MALQKEIEKAIKVQEFRQDADYLLDRSEKEYIQYALKEFTSYRNVPILMKALLSCLNTPEKLDLLLTIKDLLPRNDHKEFDRLAPYKKMAHPRTSLSKQHLLTVCIERIRRKPLGFSIRGGKEMSLGIYISNVDEGSPAHAAGMSIGDQIIEVNRINFEWISHESAVIVIKAFDKFELVLWSLGRLPYFENSTGDLYTWVDSSGKPIKHQGIADNDMDQFDDQLLSSVDKRKVVVKKEHRRSFGLKIRGGIEFKLGIFIVGVDPGSVCEEHGLQVGDQILTVNNTSFRKILHHEAAAILKNNRILIMTVKSVGRIPKLLTQEHVDNDEIKFNSLPRNFHSNVPLGFKDKLTESPKFGRRHVGRSASNVSDELRPQGISPLVASQQAMQNGSDVELQMEANTTSFEYGIGTQVMLASTVYNPVSEHLLVNARKVLNEDEVGALKRKMSHYDDGGKLKTFVQFLIAILDTPVKLDLLKDVRPLLRPQDLTKFDKLVSPHEMAAMKERRSSSKDEENILPFEPPLPPSSPSPPLPSSSPVSSKVPPPPPPPPPPVINEPVPTVTQSYQSVLQDLQSHSGPSSLRKIETIREEEEEVEGAFGNKAAKGILEKAKLLQRDSVLQSRESFLAWNENYPAATTEGNRSSDAVPPQGEETAIKTTNKDKEDEDEEDEDQPASIVSPGKPLLIDINKTAFFLGLELIKDDKGNIVIDEIVEDGAAFNDGFLQPGFVIQKVDGDVLRGLSSIDAETILNENYDSDRPNIELIVSPPSS